MRARSELAKALLTCSDAFVATGVFSFIVNICVLVSPIYMMEVYNRVLPTQSAPTLYTLTGLAIALIMVIALLEVIRSRILVRVSSKLDQQLNDRVLSAIFAGTLLAHPKASAQGLRDLDNVRQFLSGNGTLVFFDAPWAPILIAVVYLFHPVLGMVTALGAAALLLLAAFNEIATRRPLGDANSLSTRIFGLISSSLRNAEALHAMGMFQNLQRHRMRQRNEMMRLQAVASDRAGLLSAISKAFRQVLQIAVLAVGAYLALKNEVTTGEIVAASIIAGRALAPLELAIGSWKQFVSARGAYERLRGLLEAIPATEERTSLPRPRGLVEVEGVTAIAPGNNTPVVRNVAFAADPGTVIGIVGPSGAGKSTLARLIVGAWRPAAGRVRLDGADVNGWNRDELGPCIGYLPQDVELFDGTIAENIARFAPRDSGLVVAAAKRAGAHDMIVRLNRGYETEVGPGGAALSGGQRQRIGLARAMFGSPTLVVLDEPNASLDQDGERALTDAIHNLRAAGSTVILITHKSNILEITDRLLVLNEGTVRAYGPTPELLHRLLRSASPVAATPVPAARA